MTELDPIIRRAIKSGPIPDMRPWRDLPLEDLTQAERVMRFCEGLPVPEGKFVGQKIQLLPFQEAFVRSVFDNPAGTRRAYLSLGRKNGKTALCAALLIAAIVGPLARRNTQIVSGALSRDQASLVFNLASKIITQSPRLSQVIRVVPSGRRLVGLTTGVEYKALAAEGSTAHGLSPRIILADETGQIKGPQDSFIEALETSQGAHEDPLFICISTQAATSMDLLSVWLDDATKHQDERVVCHLYAADDDADLEDENAWRQANPALAVFRSIDDVREQAKQAKRLPSFESSFRSLILNTRVSTEAPFLTPGVWNSCAGPINTDIFTDGRPVFGGLDLSARTDLTALVLAARDDDGLVHLWPHVWTPQDTLLERSARDRAPYDAWVRDGFLRTTPGSAIDYDWVANDIAEVTQGMWVSACRFDRWRLDVLSSAMDRQGVALPLVPFGQGYKDMSPALEAFEGAALEARLRHGDHPVLRWCVANSVVDQDPAGNRKLNKGKSYGRIDAAVASLMAAAGILCEVETEGMTGRGELLVI